jgi:hypothetical protein
MNFQQILVMATSISQAVLPIVAPALIAELQKIIPTIKNPIELHLAEQLLAYLQQHVAPAPTPTTGA